MGWRHTPAVDSRPGGLMWPSWLSGSTRQARDMRPGEGPPAFPGLFTRAGWVLSVPTVCEDSYR